MSEMTLLNETITKHKRYKMIQVADSLKKYFKEEHLTMFPKVEFEEPEKGFVESVHCLLVHLDMDMDDDVEREEFHVIPLTHAAYEAWLADDNGYVMGDYISDFTDSCVYGFLHFKLFFDANGKSRTLFPPDLENEWKEMFSDRTRQWFEEGIARLKEAA